MIRKVCGRDIERGSYPPWRHTNPQGRGHYVKPAPTSGADRRLTTAILRPSRALPEGPSRRT